MEEYAHLRRSWCRYGICCWKKAQSWASNLIPRSASGRGWIPNVISPVPSMFPVVPKRRSRWFQLMRFRCWVFLWVLTRRRRCMWRGSCHKLSVMVDRLSDFDDIQSAFFLLRTSFSIVRATHFMRTTPLAKWADQAKRFDKAIWDAAQSILGLIFSEQTWKQACLTPRLGGLGLRKIEDHADIAFSASWRESRSTCGENWSDRADVKGHHSQKQGSLKMKRF